MSKAGESPSPPASPRLGGGAVLGAASSPVWVGPRTDFGTPENEVKHTSAPEDARRHARARVLVVGAALAIRLLLFPFAENKQADAPMRALLAERMNADPAAARDPRGFCQFGPLPIEALRPFLAADPDARRSSRLLSLIAGVAVFWPFFALGRRLVGGGAALTLAGTALAVSPLHIQVSITAASEALYLLLLLAMLRCLHAALSWERRRDLIWAGGLASLAAVTRYDTWLAVPVAAAAIWAFGGRDRRALAGAAAFVGLAAVLPAVYLLWSWIKTGDPFFFGRYITHDHAVMGQAVRARFGPGLARLRQLAIWAVSFAAVMTPLMFLRAGGAARAWRRWPPATRAVLATALAPTGAYVAKGLLLGDFEPLPRFAIAPGVVLLPLAAAAALVAGRGLGTPRRAGAAVAIGAALLSAVALCLTWARPGRGWSGAESVAPLTRLDGEDRALADYLSKHRRPGEAVFLDTLGYVDVAIAHAARVPAALTATLAHTRQLATTLSQSRAQTGASWFALHDASWGRKPPADWPAVDRRIGGWRLAYVSESGHAGPPP